MEIVKAHPDWEITASVRNSDKGAQMAAVFPHIKLVYGDLDATAMIEEEASKADIVYHFANCDHLPSAEAIARGLSKRQASTPGFWIHTSGTMILAWKSMREGYLGETREKVHNDWEGVSELVSLPDGAAHRHVDKVVLAASKENPEKIKTAIVCPPTIYGKGRGPGNTRSVQMYKATEAFLKEGQAFVVGKGENHWHEVHVADLSRLYLLLGEAAAAGGSPATWDEQGYYLAENGSFAWGEVLTAVAKEANKQGFLPSAEVKHLSVEEANKITRFLSVGTGTDSRGEAIRGKKLLGWKPREKSLLEEIPTIVTEEARALGLIKGHAAEVEQ